MSKDNIHVIRAIDKVCEARSKIIFEVDKHSPRKVSEYVASIKALISILPERYLPKNHSKMMKIESAYSYFYYPQVIRELDKVIKKIFRKLNEDGFLKR